jgi:hypothetical protein
MGRSVIQTGPLLHIAELSNVTRVIPSRGSTWPSVSTTRTKASVTTIAKVLRWRLKPKEPSDEHWSSDRMTLRACLDLLTCCCFTNRAQPALIDKHNEKPKSYLFSHWLLILRMFRPTSSWGNCCEVEDDSTKHEREWLSPNPHTKLHSCQL